MAKIKIPRIKNTDYPKDKEGWANLIIQMEDDAIAERRPQEFQWAINTAYYMGFQNLRYNSRAFEIFREVNDDLIIVNRIAPYLEQRLAKLTNIKYIPQVTPDMPDPNIRKSAELAENLFNHYWKVQDKDKKERIMAILMLLHGCAFKKLAWNPTKGDKIAKIITPLDDPDGAMALNEDGTPQQKTVFTGDVECFVRSAFSILSSPGATCVEDSDWIIDRTWITFEEAQDRFDNLDEQMVFSEREMSHYEKFVRRLQSPSFSSLIGAPSFTQERIPTQKEQRLVLVREFWKKPSKYYPGGILATVIGKQLVQFTEWPAGYTKLPFIKVDEKDNPFNFYGISTITRMIPIQRRYNEGRSQLAKNVALCANVKWAMQKGSGIPDDALTDEEGEVIEYNMGSTPPTQLNVAPIPNYVAEAMREDLLDLRDVSGEREASTAFPANVNAAVAMQEFSAQQNEVLGPIIDNIREGVEREGEIFLQLANEYYDEERKIKIVGPNNEIVVKLLSKEDLHNQTDITIGVQSGLGESKASNRQALTELWDRRVITDPQAFIEAYREANLDVAIKGVDVERTTVLTYIEDIKDGKQPELNPYVNPVMVVKMMSDFIATPEFRRLPEDRQQLGLQVLQVYVKQIQAQQEKDQNQAAVGTPYGSQVPVGRN